MNQIQGEQLAAVYFTAWLEQDEAAFLSVLHKDVRIEECDGAEYSGILECQEWFRGWHEPGNKVLQWDILESFFDAKEQTVSNVWRFTCLYDGKTSTFDGCSIISCSEEGITRLREFAMKIEKYRPYPMSEVPD
ncbi:MULTISPECIES: nuclear transport factor 2 family protein [Paenibacillus]|uniref:SnoaL-like domain-containing protein n=1 Tax=Paenibacillus borealis TaxID=160799 RepID=A0ABX3GVA8_PAEBO|nr:nuclear transport factor 2 family protein [Paenibacillus borealis]OMD37503.1 hypothetical protein BSK56_31175 [Paenibacillus borealis]